MPDRPVLEERLVGDRGGGPDRDLDGRLVAAAGLDAALEVEEDPGVGGLLELELLDLDLAVAGGRLPVDPVECCRRGPTAGRSSRAASSGASARARRGCPRGSRPAAARAAAARSAGRRRRSTPWPTDADASKNPNGSPVRIWSGSTRKWPRRVSGARTSHDRSARGPSEIARPGQAARQRRRVVDLEPRLREPARVAQRVRDPEPVADVAV